MSGGSAISWLGPEETTRPVVRLACFPHAGGDPRVLLRWTRSLPAGVVTRVACLSHDGGGSGEGKHLVALAREAADQLGRLEPAPLCVYGHSFGAVLAYETVRALPRDGSAAPTALVVTGMEAPHERVDPGHAALPDARLLEVLGGYGGTPPAVLRDTEFVEVYLSRIRRDLAMLADYRFRPGPLLRCPITVVAGRGDASLRPAAVRAWSHLTEGRCVVRFVDGGHFFVQDGLGLARLLAEPLLAAVDEP